jgi:hypothetical protein
MMHHASTGTSKLTAVLGWLVRLAVIGIFIFAAWKQLIG